VRAAHLTVSLGLRRRASAKAVFALSALPTSAREHRDAARPIVAGLGGRIVKTMGDGLLLEFPSVVAAVECAVAIQKLMVERNADVPEAKRIVYRIGVNLGDVLIEGEDILGDGVNIAARLEGICEPGGVVISGSAFDHVRDKIDAEFVDLGGKALKNIARPVRVYAWSSESKSQTPTPRVATEKKLGPRHSIVVLPFVNIGGDPEQDYFVDGVRLSGISNLGTPPKKRNMRTCAPVQSGSCCVQVASA
jgi:hypothetical protein